MALFAFYFPCNFIGYFKQALKSDWLSNVLVFLSQMAQEKVGFRAENSLICELTASQRANQIARITIHL